MNKKITEMMVSDAMVEKPITFKVKDKDFKINPPTLGKLQILSKYYLLLDIDEKSLDAEPHLEAMRICNSKSDLVCEMMSIAVSNSREELLDDNRIKELTEFFKWNSSPSDFSFVILAILTQSHYENFISSIRLTKTFRLNEPRD